jgi:DNA topoisomerase VI subunit A
MVRAVTPDPDIERLEAELRQSRFQKWEVETFLANRHRAKIEALTPAEGEQVSKVQILKELADVLLIFVGRTTLFVLFGVWLLKGFPLP